MGEDNGNGRDQRGLFVAGNAFSRGNIGNARMKELRRALLECGTPERVAAVEKTLYSAAVGGDISAIRVWLEHMVGRPVQAVHVGGPDGGPMGLDVASLTQIVLVALAGHPEAKLAVADALGRVVDDRPPDVV